MATVAKKGWVRLGPDNVRQEVVDIATLRPHPRNARNGDLEAIEESIDAHGVYRSIVVSSDDVVLAGNHTYMAALGKGQSRIQVDRLPLEHTHQQALAILAVDNRLNDLARYDNGLLAELLTELDDLTGTGYDADALAELLAEPDPVGGIGDPNSVPAPPRDPVTKRGDLWLLGDHRLLCGDTTSLPDLGRVLGGHPADMVVTDPPYGVAYEGGQASKKRSRMEGDDRDLYATVLPLLHQVSADNAPLYLFFAGSRGRWAYDAVEGAGYSVRALLIWNKLNPHYGAFMSQYMPRHEPFLYAVKGGKVPWHGPTNEVTVWDVDQPRVNEHHPTQKPVELIERAIRNSSRPGALILDGFGGSGSTLLAAHTQHRRAALLEVEPRYCDVICRRFEEFTGITPQREDGTEVSFTP